MVVVRINDIDLYMDGYLKNNLDLAKQTIKKDWDFIFVYDGIEGGGKSLKAQQDAYYCDPTITLDRITFTPKEFREAVLKAKPYQAVIFDEAYGGLSSRSAMSAVNKMLVTMLTEIRQKNLFIFIVLPCFFDLDKYVALWRSRALIHVYTGDNFQRGFFAFYNYAKKKDLYVLGKKTYCYHSPAPNFRGRFARRYVINEKDYKAKKLKSLEDKGDYGDEPERESFSDELFRHVYPLDLPFKIKLKVLGISDRWYFKLKKKLINVHNE